VCNIPQTRATGTIVLHGCEFCLLCVLTHDTPKVVSNLWGSVHNQEETDRLWHAIIDNGGQASACGWCKDKWGLSWQISPRVLVDAVTSTDPAVAKRAFEAMMTMTKIDIAAIEAAIAGN